MYPPSSYVANNPSTEKPQECRAPLIAPKEAATAATAAAVAGQPEPHVAQSRFSAFFGRLGITSAAAQPVMAASATAEGACDPGVFTNQVWEFEIDGGVQG